MRALYATHMAKPKFNMVGVRLKQKSTQHTYPGHASDAFEGCNKRRKMTSPDISNLLLQRGRCDTASVPFNHAASHSHLYSPEGGFHSHAGRVRAYSLGEAV